MERIISGKVRGFTLKGQGLKLAEESKEEAYLGAYKQSPAFIGVGGIWVGGATKFSFYLILEIRGGREHNIWVLLEQWPLVL